MSPKVTIVTPSFNQAGFLERTLQSVLGQTYPQIEYIVIDGGSTDGSVEIIQKYAARLSHWESAPDQGPASAINRGFARGTGAIHAYLNSDDLYEPDAVERAVDALSKGPGPAVLYGDVRFIDAGGAPTTFPGKRVETYRAAPFMAGALFHEAMFIPQQASFWHPGVFARVGPMNEENWTCWDHEFFVDAALAGVPFVRVPRVLASFRIHATSISSENRWQDRRERDHLRIDRKIAAAGYAKGRAKGLAYRQAVRLLRALRTAVPSL